MRSIKSIKQTVNFIGHYFFTVSLCLFLILIIFVPVDLLSQGFGLVIQEDHYREQPDWDRNDGSKSNQAILDSVQHFSLKSYCPTPLSQGNTASCVGWAVGYSAQTIHKAYSLGITDISEIDSMALSPSFIFNHVKLKDCNLGAEIPDALKFMMTTGNVARTSFDIDAEECFVTPESPLYVLARENRIRDFRKIFAPGDQRLNKVNSTKLALLDGLPVIIAMNVTESFFKMESGKDTWYSELGSQNSLGAHALVVVGFDEIENAFEVMNSWGTGWANEGFAWIRYKDFEKYAVYGFSFYQNQEESKLLSLTINFRRKSLITDEYQVQYTQELFNNRENIYLPVNSEASQNSSYKIEITHSTEEYSIICFNKSGNGKYKRFFQIGPLDFDHYSSTPSYGVTFPDDRAGSVGLTDPNSEHFIFIITSSPLKKTMIEKISSCDDFDCLNSAIYSNYTVDSSSRYSYNKVGVITPLKEGIAIVLPVLFDYDPKQ